MSIPFQIPQNLGTSKITNIRRAFAGSRFCFSRWESVAVFYFFSTSDFRIIRKKKPKNSDETSWLVLFCSAPERESVGVKTLQNVSAASDFVWKQFIEGAEVFCCRGRSWWLGSFSWLWDGQRWSIWLKLTVKRTFGGSDLKSQSSFRFGLIKKCGLISSMHSVNL